MVLNGKPGIVPLSTLLGLRVTKRKIRLKLAVSIRAGEESVGPLMLKVSSQRLL